MKSRHAQAFVPKVHKGRAGIGRLPNRAQHGNSIEAKLATLHEMPRRDTADGDNLGSLFGLGARREQAPKISEGFIWTWPIARLAQGRIHWSEKDGIVPPQ
jgi:hypothetical protein